MRNIYVSSSGIDACCAVSVLHDFPTHYSDYNSDNEVAIDKLSDAEWFQLLSNVRREEYSGAPIYLFANAAKANEGGCTPAKLAKWLRSKGEKVSTGVSAVNPSTNNLITVYSWAISKAFEKKLQNYKNKKTTKNDAERRGSRAA